MTIESDGANGSMCDRPLAAPGLVSYRYRGRYGWVMIGAKNHDDAMNEAKRSNPENTWRCDLEVWDAWERKYVPAY